ncbi:MAG: polyhydroxyalkanoate synthesis repressor PhaR [Parvularculaceae bacterium]
MSEKEANAEKPTGRKKRRDDEPVVIKKYANRRLYNTATSSYVTLDYLAEMVKNGQDFVVYDAKSNDDITHSVLTQIIFEEENKGQNLLPIQFLRQLIQFYGDNLQAFVPSYLEMSMDAFSKNQENMRTQIREAFGASPGYAMFEEMARQNMALFDQATKMFTPPGVGGFYSQSGKTPSGAANAGEESSPDELKTLKDELADLKRQLSKLERDR